MLFWLAAALHADPVLHPGTPVLDRPTLTTLGIQLPLSGDDNFNAAVAVRYRQTGASAWNTGLPLFRVHPETVAYYTVSQQFAGSIFDLRPATSYDIELHATDPDGTDQIFTLTAITRALPVDPVAPNIRNVTDTNSLSNALGSARPGDVILLANGVYSGPFDIYSGGVPGNPIVVRGASEDGVILDGGNCTGCNIFEVYGAGYLHLENMTIQNGERAIRFQTNGAIANSVRHVHVKNTILGIGLKGTQYDFYIADNILEGRLLWPQIYSDDNGLHSNDDGIAVSGFGHVVAHNRISGYGDAMKTLLDGARAIDFYGNEVLYTYDNAVELDGSEGNTRAFRNRYMNTYSPLSVQPVHGGPAYLLRNVVVNAADEQLKFHLHANPNQEPSGILVYHNTFVSPNLELTMQTTATSHYFAIENNLFIGPASNAGGLVVDWLGINDHGLFDYNGYFPDGQMTFHNPPPAGYLNVNSFAGLAGTGYETHGLIAAGPVFAYGLSAPPSYTVQMAPADATLAPGSVVQDKGLVLPNINDHFTGAGPDLGALESGCPNPIYGPRPAGIDESNEVVGCSGTSGVTSVTVTPAKSVLTPNAAQQFTAATTPSGAAVLWQIAPARGSISANGLYTAPSDALLGEVITVTSTSLADPAVFGTATVDLSNTVQVVAQGGVTMTQGAGQIQLSASVHGALNTGVTWRLEAPYGTITPSGLYTAPAAPTPGYRVTAIATSVADPTKSATVRITFAAPSVVLAPGAGTIQSGSTVQFSATVSGSAGNVSWSISPAVGTISSSGLYSAPAAVSKPVSVTVTAKSAGSLSGTGAGVINLVP